MTKILIADPVAEECVQILKSAGFEVDNRGKMKPEDLKAAISDFEGLVIRSGAKVTREIIEAAKKLKVIGRAGVGTDNVDKVAASEKGIIVMNAPLGNVTSTAEHTFALMLAQSRNIVRGSMSLLEGKWERPKFKGVELEGKTLGIVGLGKIGSQVGRYAKAFGMRVIAFDPLITKERAEELEIDLMELDQVLSEADYITLHVPLNDKTRGMINADQLKKMKKTARLINTSRGAVVDAKALAEAVSSGALAGAALDVYEVEPPPADHPMMALEKMTLTPHLAASTVEAQVKVAVTIGEQFVDYFKKGVVRNAVNEAELAKRR